MSENTHAHTYRIIRKVKEHPQTAKLCNAEHAWVYEVKAFRWFRDEMTRFKKTFNRGGLQMGIIDWDYHYHERIQYFVETEDLKEGQEGEFGDGVLTHPYRDTDCKSDRWWSPCPEKGMILGGSRTFIQTHGINDTEFIVNTLTKHDIDVMIETLKNLRIHEAGEDEE